MKRLSIYIGSMLFCLTWHNRIVAQEAQAHTTVAQQLMAGTSLIKQLIADTTFNLYEGVAETSLHYVNANDQPMHVFILRADLRNKHIGLHLLTADTSALVARQTLSGMINASGFSGHIIAGVNADFFNLDTGSPMGIVYKNGVAVKDSFTNAGKPQQGLSYLAVEKGQAVIGNKEEKNGRLPVTDAAGGGVFLLKDHEAIPQTIRSIHPRTAVGITSNQVIYFIVADGRNISYSNGMQYEEMAMLLKALNIKEAINLDGGGSSTFITRRPINNQLTIRNRPADGTERAIANGWVITVD